MRHDVLCYTGEPLTAPLEATGHVTLTVHLSSSAPDTDVTGKLVDVFPDGRAILLCEGLCRLSDRDSAPGEVVEVTVDMGVTSNVFRTGHRVRLEVSAGNYPRYDRNFNGAGATARRVAVNRVLHGPAHPSRLTLPVIRRDR
jgi:putative CocE/NonD family hydrolase